MAARSHQTAASGVSSPAHLLQAQLPRYLQGTRTCPEPPRHEAPLGHPCSPHTQKVHLKYTRFLLLVRLREGNSGQGMHPDLSSKPARTRHRRINPEQSQREVKTFARIFRGLSKSFPFICLTAKELHQHQRGKPQASYFKMILCLMGNESRPCFYRTRPLLSLYLQQRPLSTLSRAGKLLPVSENSLECPQLHSAGYGSTQRLLCPLLWHKSQENYVF